jgi:hypothetical protein
MPKIYPGWKMRVYCAEDVEALSKNFGVYVIDRLKSLDVQIEYMGVSHEHSGMLWRFLPAWEKDVDRVIFRDADSRIGPREAAAVQAWIESGLDAHCMHDHPHHNNLPVFGGMWGVKGGILPNLMPVWTRFMSSLKRRVEDMHLLRLYIYPHIENSLLRHSSHPLRWDSKPFPSHEAWEGFVGQQIDDDGNPVGKREWN